MTTYSSIEVDVVLDVPVETAWSAVTDWPRQSSWVTATTVRNTAQDGVGVGGGLEAVTGWGPLVVVDPMVIVEWDPPRRVVVQHQGNVVRGSGTFEVFKLPGDRSRFVWAESLELPFGWAGRLVWPVVRPIFAAGVRHSLRRFRQTLEPVEGPDAA